jgi:phosphatidylglycerophosphatase B
MGSRLLLGMHWPRDLVVATLISWMLVTIASWLAQRLCGPLTPPSKRSRKSPKESRKVEILRLDPKSV